MKTKQYLTELAKFIHNLQSEAEVVSFLQAILTPAELEEIPKRLQIVKMLKQGISQREIANQLSVGVATITRGSKELHQGSFKNV